MRFASPLAVTFSTAISVALPSQAEWTQKSPATSPAARIEHSMVYDLARGRCVMFGGRATSVFGDTWEYDGVNWTQDQPLTSPMARSNHALAYDVRRAVVVLFSGNLRTATNPADTWEWNGTTWTRAAPTRSPSAREIHAMTFDVVRGRTVLFGGNAAGFQLQNDTWEYDGTNWTQVQTATSPPPRWGHALAFDSDRGVVVMFGGAGLGFTMDDTWEYDGVDWKLVSPLQKPPSHDGHGLVYDSLRRRIVMFGGFGDGVGWLNDTWEYDGVTWVRRQPTRMPAPRCCFGMAYDRIRARAVLFAGGTDVYRPADTWEYGPVTPAACVPFGSGCPGNAGVPALGAEAGSLPWLGDTFRARLTNVGPNPFLNAPFLMLGDSKSAWGTSILPLDLAWLGMSGCTAYCNSLVAFALANHSGSAIWEAAVPNVPGLAGAIVYAQAGVTSPGANAFGLALGNACEIRLGAR